MKIGTRVKVINLLKHFPRYTEMFETMGFKKPKKHRGIADLMFLKDNEFVVFSKENHEDNGTILYGIIDKKGNQFLFEKEGLQKIKKSKTVKEEPIQEEIKEKPFPKVMKSIFPNLHVLFESEKIGQVVIPNRYWGVGHISESWDMDTFEDIKEPITITFN